MDYPNGLTVLVEGFLVPEDEEEGLRDLRRFLGFGLGFSAAGSRLPSAGAEASPGCMGCPGTIPGCMGWPGTMPGWPGTMPGWPGTMPGWPGTMPGWPGTMPGWPAMAGVAPGAGGGGV